jgi:hypothetical protein
MPGCRYAHHGNFRPQVERTHRRSPLQRCARDSLVQSFRTNCPRSPACDEPMPSIGESSPTNRKHHYQLRSCRFPFASKVVLGLSHDRLPLCPARVASRRGHGFPNSSVSIPGVLQVVPGSTTRTSVPESVPVGAEIPASQHPDGVCFLRRVGRLFAFETKACFDEHFSKSDHDPEMPGSASSRG